VRRGRPVGTVSELTVTFVGSGDAFGSGGRLQTCLHVSGDAGHVLIDCGASSLIGLKRAGLDPSSIDAVVLSHLHGDHFGGVPFLILDGQFSRRTRPLVVAGPPGVRTRLEAAMEVFFPGSSTVARRFETRVVELEPRVRCAVGPVSVTAYPVDHPSGAMPFAVRVEHDGKVVAYSGDTAWTETLLEAARDADLFVCEAYTFERKVKFHLDYTTLARERARLGCRRLIVTHMSDEVLARLGELECESAEDGRVITV
jgi:ribonuclease BN (tRNA processing enzyme)